MCSRCTAQAIQRSRRSTGVGRLRRQSQRCQGGGCQWIIFLSNGAPMGRMRIGMSIWQANVLDLDDDLNQVIWSQSPDLQICLDPPRFGREGAVGAAQGLGGAPALPWVPDSWAAFGESLTPLSLWEVPTRTSSRT